MIGRLLPRWQTLAVMVGLVAGGLGTVQAQPTTQMPQLLRVITFGGASNLPIWAATRQGFFAQEGLEVQVTFTPNSIYQMTELAAGRYDVALTAIDNVIAYDEAQADVKLEPTPDFFAFVATDNAFLSLTSQASFPTVESLRGQTVTVDAMTTGFAFVLKDVLARHEVGENNVKYLSTGGFPSRLQAMLKDPTQAATIQGTPFELIGEDHGFHTVLRLEDAVGPYQGFVGAARQRWAREHESTVVGFTRALLKAIAWLYRPENRPIAEALLVADVPGMTPALASRTYDIVLGQHGFYRDGRPSAEGMARVLALRTKYALPHKDLTDSSRYFDASYLTKASAADHP